MRDTDAAHTSNALRVTLDRTQFAEQYEQMVLALEELTPHQTEKLKEFGMSVQQRKKLLSHVEKYKRGLWAPKELRR